MAHPTFRMLQTGSVFALLLVLGSGACGDRGGGRPQGTAGETVSDTGTTAQRGADTVTTPVPRADTGQVVAPGTTLTDTTPRARTGGASRTTAPGKSVSSAAARAASLDSLHPFMPVTITLEAPPTPTRPRVLRSVRAGRHAGFERVVFQMAGDTLPGYRIAYVEPPVVACGSGRRVSLAGGAVLVVRLEPARAHDDAGQPTIEERSQKPGFSVLKELAQTCDFEGQVHWALGLAQRVPFRVLKLDDPARLVLDLQQGSP